MSCWLPCVQRRTSYHLAEQQPELFWRLVSELKKHHPSGPARDDIARRCLVGGIARPLPGV